MLPPPVPSDIMSFSFCTYFAMAYGGSCGKCCSPVRFEVVAIVMCLQYWSGVVFPAAFISWLLFVVIVVLLYCAVKLSSCFVSMRCSVLLLVVVLFRGDLCLLIWMSLLWSGEENCCWAKKTISPPLL